MIDYVKDRKCNALLRRGPDPSRRPLEQATERLPKRHWVGGRLTVTSGELWFQGDQVYEGRHRELFDFTAPLGRIVGTRVRRGPLIARFIAIEIDDGSRLHLRPSKLTQTLELLDEAIGRSS